MHLKIVFIDRRRPPHCYIDCIFVFYATSLFSVSVRVATVSVVPPWRTGCPPVLCGSPRQDHGAHIGRGVVGNQKGTGLRWILGRNQGVNFSPMWVLLPQQGLKEKLLGWKERGEGSLSADL